MKKHRKGLSGVCTRESRDHSRINSFASRVLHTTHTQWGSLIYRRLWLLLPAGIFRIVCTVYPYNAPQHRMCVCVCLAKCLRAAAAIYTCIMHHQAKNDFCLKSLNYMPYVYVACRNSLYSDFLFYILKSMGNESIGCVIVNPH